MRSICLPAFIDTGLAALTFDERQQFLRLLVEVASHWVNIFHCCIVSIDNGVDYIFTHPVFDESALDKVETFRKDVLIMPGVLVLSGLDHARHMALTPGIRIPEAVFSRLERFDQPED